MLIEHGPSFECNLTKCHMFVKPEINTYAVKTFHDIKVEIVEGSSPLRSVISSENACRTQPEKVAHDHSTLARQHGAHSNVSPQNVYKSLTNSLHYKLPFLTRTTPNIDNVLQET